MAKRNDILAWCDEVLQVGMFKDYAPNGLQVEGRAEVGKIATSVTASKAAVDFAAEQGADMLLVHHGMFWKSEPVTITGWKKARIETLLQHQINMVGYHLPLDAHPVLGNNAQLADKLGWEVERQFGEQNLLNIGRLKTPQTICYEIQREIVREARRYDVQSFRILAAPNVIDLFLDEESQSLAMLIDFIGKPISLAVETAYTQEQYDIVLL